MIIDTNALSAFFRGEPTLLTLFADSRDCTPCLPTVVLGEYRYGLMRSRQADALERRLGELCRMWHVLQVDENTAKHYAQVREELRSKGRPIPENDVWIAALARQHGPVVVSRDSHFDFVPGLERLNW